MPGGVNSPVRAFRGVGGSPLFIHHGEGSRIFDVDGNSYIDYVCSWGPLILGHRPPFVTEALREALEIRAKIECYEYLMITGERIAELLFGLNRGSDTTLLLVTHDAALAARCGRIVAMEAGALQGSAPAPARAHA